MQRTHIKSGWKAENRIYQSSFYSWLAISDILSCTIINNFKFINLWFFLCQITKIAKVVQSSWNPLLRQVTVTWDLFRKGTEMRERYNKPCIEKKDQSDLTPLYLLIGSWLSFKWPNVSRIYMQAFPGIFCYI